MKAELQQLVALQNLDTSIRKLQAELEAIPQRRAEIESEFDQRAFEIRALENARDEARHARTRLETEVGEQRVRVERAERNLMSSKKQDEYTAAIREADAARKQISTLETQILEQMEALEKAEASLTERAEEIASLNSDREARLQAFDDETRQQADKLAIESHRTRTTGRGVAQGDGRALRSHQRAHTRRRGGGRSAQRRVHGLLHGAATAGDGPGADAARKWSPATTATAFFTTRRQIRLRQARPRRSQRWPTPEKQMLDAEMSDVS